MAETSIRAIKNIHRFITDFFAQKQLLVVQGANIGASNDTWVDAGSVIDGTRYSGSAFYIKYTANDSFGAQIQVLRMTAPVSTEYVMEDITKYQRVIGDSNINVVYDFKIDNTTPYFQIQTKATLVGSTKGTITLLCVKGNK